MDIKKAEKTREMIRQHQEDVQPAGHNTLDEDIAKVASIDVIGKAVETTDELKK